VFQLKKFKILKKNILNLNKKVVYTGITGCYDELLTPSYVNEDWDYVCFTDNKNLKSDFWQIRIMESSNLDQIRRARNYKILPHKYLSEYKISLWIDGNFRITGDMNKFIEKYSEESPLMTFVHPDRDCIYDEADEVVNAKKDLKKTVYNQIDKLINEKYPKNQGLIASGILYRKHNDPEVKKLMNSWWKEVREHSRRDQLSFNYVCWKNNFKYDECYLSYWGNEFFQRLNHR
jgi:hypothetical protein